MATKQKIRKSPKREQIFSTAQRLFSRFGAKRVTVEEICRQARVSKMTFYKYFANKLDLVRSIRDQWVQEGFAKFDQINALDVPFPEKIKRMTGWKVEFTSRINADFIREMVSIDEVMEQAKQRHLANIKDAQKKGEIRADIKPEFFLLVVEKLTELVRDDAWRSVFSDFSEYQRQVRTLLFFGLLTRPDEQSPGAHAGRDKAGKGREG